MADRIYPPLHGYRAETQNGKCEGKAGRTQCDDALAAAEWRRYRLIEDAARDLEELLAEGIAVSVKAMELAPAYGDLPPPGE